MPRPAKGIRLHKYAHRPQWYILETGQKPTSSGTDCLGKAATVLRLRKCQAQRPTIVGDDEWSTEIKKMHRKARDRAKTRGQDFCISVDDIALLIRQQNFRCSMSGLPFSTGRSDTGRCQPFAPSLDRVDNTRGYVAGNIRLVCVIVNLARADFSDDEFVVMCRAVAGQT